MNDYIENLKNHVDVRQATIALKLAVRTDDNGKALAESLAGDFSVLTALIDHEDPKIRKNAAAILGVLEQEGFRDLLWEGYCREQTLYVRAEYLKALTHYDCTPYLAQLKQRLQALQEAQNPKEEEKHIREEQTALKNLLIRTERPRKHKFVTGCESTEVILLTNREHRDVTIRQLPAVKKMRKLAGGVRFVTEELGRVLPIRTYSEILFPVPGAELLEGSPANMARTLVDSQMLAFLEKHHNFGAPFYFRLEVRSSMPQNRKVDLIKKFVAALEKESGQKLQNAPGGYEVELRLVASKEGRFVPLLKLFTIYDGRFAYREESLPVSIAPVNAALIMQLAGGYLIEGAQVLDPFCGVGTMLIERAAFGRTGSLYGVDILEEAILKARANTTRARLDVHYINRNFFHFEHDYLFDEIVTDLPGLGKTRGPEELSMLYRQFLEKIPEVVKKNAVIVAYTPVYRTLFTHLRRHPEMRILGEYCLNEREQSFVVIFRYCGT